jgi:hypothetical protein
MLLVRVLDEDDDEEDGGEGGRSRGRKISILLVPFLDAYIPD